MSGAEIAELVRRLGTALEFHRYEAAAEFASVIQDVAQARHEERQAENRVQEVEERGHQLLKDTQGS